MIKVCAIQFKANQRKHKEALQEIETLCQSACALADLVVLPEMACTNYLFDSFDDALPYAQPANGEIFERLSPIAVRFESVIVIGFIEKAINEEAETILYNSALILMIDGTFICYRKRLLFDADTTWARSGNLPYPIFKIKNQKVTVGICMDLNDDEFTSFCRDNKINIIAFPTNWLDQNYDIRPYWYYRLSYPALLVAANTYGKERSTTFRGYSTIMYHQMVLAEMGYAGNGMIFYEMPNLRSSLKDMKNSIRGETLIYDQHHCESCAHGTCEIHDDIDDGSDQ